MSRPTFALLPVLLLLVAGCTTEKQSSPARTATEQLLISTAADRAANSLDLKIPVGTKVFIDSTYFQGTDSRYALSAIRANFLRRGAALVPRREDAAAVVELRAAALSIDESETLVGLRSFVLPIPLAGDLTTPEIAFFKVTERQGVAKFAAFSYGAADGRRIAFSEPAPAYATDRYWLVFLFFSWTTSDLPDEEGYEVPIPW
ncbi:MAG: hypothetical protein Kilf2KO_44290 [Rhodospirillales bacterium]